MNRFFLLVVFCIAYFSCVAQADLSDMLSRKVAQTEDQSGDDNQLPPGNNAVVDKSGDVDSLLLTSSKDDKKKIPPKFQPDQNANDASEKDAGGNNLLETKISYCSNPNYYCKDGYNCFTSYYGNFKCCQVGAKLCGGGCIWNWQSCCNYRDGIYCKTGRCYYSTWFRFYFCL